MFRAAVLAVLAPVALAGAFPSPASAEAIHAENEIRIAVARNQLRDPHSLARVRKEITVAAKRLCNPAGLSSVHPGAGRRCRASVIADAERQLDHGGTRLAELSLK